MRFIVMLFVNIHKFKIIYFFIFLSSNLYGMDCSKRFYMEDYNVYMISKVFGTDNIQARIAEINNSEGALLYLKGLMLNYGFHYDRNYTEALDIFDSLSFNDGLASFQSGLILLLCEDYIEGKSKFHDLSYYFDLAYENGEVRAGYFKFTFLYSSGVISLKQYIYNLSKIYSLDKYPLIEFELVYQKHIVDGNLISNAELVDFFSTCDFFDILINPNLYNATELRGRLVFIMEINSRYYNRCLKTGS